MKNTIFAFAFVALLAGGCGQTDGSAPASTSDQQKVDLAKDGHQTHRISKEDFLEHLKSGKELHSFFSDHWTLIYHEDNRCDGSTGGEVDDLPKAKIDKTIGIKVENDGDGWLRSDGGCNDRRYPDKFDLNFSLKERVASWDRFEIANTENQPEGVVYIHGGGESDYLVLHYGKDNLIIKMEYRSEDPG